MAQAALRLRSAADAPHGRRPRRAPGRRLVRDAEADRRLHRPRGRRLSRAVGDVRAPRLPRQVGRRVEAVPLSVSRRRLRSRRPRRRRAAAARRSIASPCDSIRRPPSSRSSCEARRPGAAATGSTTVPASKTAASGICSTSRCPAGTGWWFTLGSVLLFGLTVQVVTGIALALYYAPTPDHAWDSVRYITHAGARRRVSARPPPLGRQRRRRRRRAAPAPRRVLRQLPEAARGELDRRHRSCCWSSWRSA